AAREHHPGGPGVYAELERLGKPLGCRRAVHRDACVVLATGGELVPLAAVLVEERRDRDLGHRVPLGAVDGAGSHGTSGSHAAAASTRAGSCQRRALSLKSPLSIKFDPDRNALVQGSTQMTRRSTPSTSALPVARSPHPGEP